MASEERKPIMGSVIWGLKSEMTIHSHNTCELLNFRVHSFTGIHMQ